MQIYIHTHTHTLIHTRTHTNKHTRIQEKQLLIGLDNEGDTTGRRKHAAPSKEIGRNPY